ncbi:MAG: RnfABCDGE type electron transport complex subunit D [Candidatus Cloacimonetes bacterium]|nr:RnfABCDGE type electron transport complex subunit D [Candidatus Cloacimonadota bacterium]
MKLFMKQQVMNKVLYALAPITVFSVFLFGWRVLAVLAVSNLCAVISEYLFVRTKQNGKISMAVFVTASLLALTLPPTIPFWMAGVGAVFAIVFGKMVFGGFGMNVFNPAIVGRTFIYISFPNAMTVQWLKPFSSWPGGFTSWQNSAAITSATPMSLFKSSGEITSTWHLASGLIPGSAGETSAILIALAAIYLIVTKTAKWQSMLATLLGFTISVLAFYQQNPLPFILSGGLLFGSVFMVTDPISMPKNKTAIWIYGALVGFLTVFIRKFSLFTEGFMFALLLANTFMPIIEYALDRSKRKGA